MKPQKSSLSSKHNLFSTDLGRETTESFSTQNIFYNESCYKKFNFYKATFHKRCQFNNILKTFQWKKASKA